MPLQIRFRNHGINPFIGRHQHRDAGRLAADQRESRHRGVEVTAARAGILLLFFRFTGFRGRLILSGGFLFRHLEVKRHRVVRVPRSAGRFLGCLRFGIRARFRGRLQMRGLGRRRSHLMNPVIRRAHPRLPLTVRKPAGIDVKEVRESEKNIRLDLPCIAGKPLRDGGLRDANLIRDIALLIVHPLHAGTEPIGKGLFCCHFVNKAVRN